MLKLEYLELPNMHQLLKSYRIQIWQLHPIKDVKFNCVRPYKVKPGILYWGFLIKREDIPDNCHWHLDSNPIYLYKKPNDRRVFIYKVVSDSIKIQDEQDMFDMLDSGMDLDSMFEIVML